METLDRPRMPRDFLGKVIKEGDVLVYPVRRGSDMRLKRLMVARLDPSRGAVIGRNTEGRSITLTKPERSVIVEVN